MKTDAIDDLQLQNWDNFYQYHTSADWYGTWTRYSNQGEATESFQGIRSFQPSQDGNEVYHQNHYTYADGTQQTKTFGPYKKPTIKGLYLDNSFSEGSLAVKSGSHFGFETGFRHQDRRNSVVVLYDDWGNLQRFTVINEQLGKYPDRPSSESVLEFNSSCPGITRTMTPDLNISSTASTTWRSLLSLENDYHKVDFPESISLICPRKIEPEQDLFVAVDWLVNPTLLLRGIRKYNASALHSFTLEEFKIS